MSDEAPRSLRESVRQLDAVHTSLRNLRDFLQSERNTPAEHRRAREAFDQEMDDMAQDDSRSISARASQLRQNERRRPYIDLPAEAPETARGPSPAPASSVSTGSSPANLVRSRRRAFRSSQRLARHHQDRPAQLVPPSSTFTPSARSTSPPHDPPNPYTTRDYGSRAKRRKLDDGSYQHESKSVNYGHKGQVVPGQLKLEIASCDGGEYQDPDISTNSRPQNVLQDDATVYCTKSNRCNMLLRHVSGMPFTLTKIVVKAPRSGYDAPIQEGMIFVAMSDEHILEKTSRYEIQYSPKNYRHHRQLFERTRSTQDYINSARSPLQTIDRTRYLRNPHSYRRPENDPLLESAIVPGFDISTGDPSDDEHSQAAPISPRPWHYTDQEDSYRPYVDRYRPQYHEPPNDERDDRWSASSDSDLADHLADAAEMVAVLNEMGEDGEEAHRILRGTRRGAQVAAHIAATRAMDRASGHLDEDTDSDSTPPPQMNPSTGPAMTSRLQPIAAAASGYERLTSSNDVNHSKSASGSDNVMSVDAAASSSDIVVPHARFRIPWSKCSVAISFNPPIAGRYILIKLWAPCPNANIDVQAITAHGYGGPRFFPAVEMR